MKMTKMPVILTRTGRVHRLPVTTGRRQNTYSRKISSVLLELRFQFRKLLIPLIGPGLAQLCTTGCGMMTRDEWTKLAGTGLTSAGGEGHFIPTKKTAPRPLKDTGETLIMIV